MSLVSPSITPSLEITSYFDEIVQYLKKFPREINTKNSRAVNFNSSIILENEKFQQ